MILFSFGFHLLYKKFNLHGFEEMYNAKVLLLFHVPISLLLRNGTDHFFTKQIKRH